MDALYDEPQGLHIQDLVLLAPAFMMLGGTGNNMGMLIGTFIFFTLRSLIFVYNSYSSIRHL